MSKMRLAVVPVLPFDCLPVDAYPDPGLHGFWKPMTAAVYCQTHRSLSQPPFQACFRVSLQPNNTG